MSMPKYLLVLVAVAALAGCTSATSSSTPPPTTPAIPASTAPAIPSDSATPTPTGSMTAQQIAATLGCSSYVAKTSAGQTQGPMPTTQGTCLQESTSYTIAAYQNTSEVQASVALFKQELSVLSKVSVTIGSGGHYVILRSGFNLALKPAMVAAVHSSGGTVTTINPSHG